MGLLRVLQPDLRTLSFESRKKFPKIKDVCIEPHNNVHGGLNPVGRLCAAGDDVRPRIFRKRLVFP